MSFGEVGKTYRLSKWSFVLLAFFQGLTFLILEAVGFLILFAPFCVLFGLMNYYMGGGKK